MIYTFKDENELYNQLMYTQGKLMASMEKMRIMLFHRQCVYTTYSKV